MRDWLWFQFCIRAKQSGGDIERLQPHRVFCESSNATVGEWWHTPYYDDADDFGVEEFLANTGDFDDCVTQLMLEPTNSPRAKWLCLKAYYLHPIPTGHAKYKPVDARAPYGIRQKRSRDDG